MRTWRTRRIVWGLAMLVALIALLVAPLSAGAAAGAPGRRVVFPKELEFNQAMRKLWEDHIIWTRQVIVSFAADLPDTELAVERLLQNQVDIGDAIKPFYGEAAGDQLTELLREHILLAAEILAAAKAGDTDAFNDAVERWYANADEIAAFLNAANPEFWPLEEMEQMMREHLDLTLAEASARLGGDLEADIAAFDAVHLQILEMADMLSEGIINQFPQQFRMSPPHEDS